MAAANEDRTHETTRAQGVDYFTSDKHPSQTDSCAVDMGGW